MNIILSVLVERCRTRMKINRCAQGRPAESNIPRDTCVLDDLDDDRLFDFGSDPEGEDAYDRRAQDSDSDDSDSDSDEDFDGVEDEPPFALPALQRYFRNANCDASTADGGSGGSDDSH